MDIRTLCLGLLTFGEATGYEIKKAFQDRMSMVYDASFSSIYPSLNRLTKEGLVSCRAESQSRRPDRKVYSITPAGREEFLKEIHNAPAADKFRSDFLATLMFSHLLQPGNVSRLIDNQIMDYRQKKDELSQGCGMKQSQSEQFLCGFGVTMYQAAIEYLEQNRHLIEAPAPVRAPAKQSVK
ncbi:PadR family transcriptional regulator [Sneathiella chinensis]|uniref:PadR family transcriptional regulator n=1 Tax=Sneathiella chinensis TaxID=349750 RepID=A0ABQ5U6Z3_9PROT|nr:PadR family transcriptional regulator [Sneathiella chinensis]GLQ07077.1 PadR family transcriptional regulator [Sneathiella chinensis]